MNINKKRNKRIPLMAEGSIFQLESSVSDWVTLLRLLELPLHP